MGEVIQKLRRTKTTSGIMADLLAAPMPPAYRNLLCGRRKDGSRKKGRPKTGTLPFDLPDDATFGSALASVIIARALAGDPACIKTVLAFTEGLPLRMLQHVRPAPDDSFQMQNIQAKLMRMIGGKSEMLEQLEPEATSDESQTQE